MKILKLVFLQAGGKTCTDRSASDSGLERILKELNTHALLLKRGLRSAFRFFSHPL
jgi:hypothetical protein